VPQCPIASDATATDYIGHSMYVYLIGHRNLYAHIAHCYDGTAAFAGLEFAGLENDRLENDGLENDGRSRRGRMT